VELLLQSRNTDICVFGLQPTTRAGKAAQGRWEGPQPRETEIAAHRDRTDLPPSPFAGAVPPRRRSLRVASIAAHPPSRAAVIGVTSRADASPQGAATPCGLTADPAHNRKPSAGQAQAGHADTPANQPALRPAADARALTAPAPSTVVTLGRAHAPGASPKPSRLTRTPGDRSLTGLPSGREVGSLPAAYARAGDSARIAHPFSAPATPAAGASAAQGGTATSHPRRAPTPSPIARARVAHLLAETVGKAGDAAVTAPHLASAGTLAGNPPSPDLPHPDFHPVHVVPATTSSARVGSNRKDKLLVPSLRASVRRWRAPGQAMRGRREALVAALHGPTEDKAARRPAAASGVRGFGERAQHKREMTQ